MPGTAFRGPKRSNRIEARLMVAPTLGGQGLCLCLALRDDGPLTTL